MSDNEIQRNYLRYGGAGRRGFTPKDRYGKELQDGDTVQVDFPEYGPHWGIFIWEENEGKFYTLIELDGDQELTGVYPVGEGEITGFDIVTLLGRVEKGEFERV